MLHANVADGVHRIEDSYVNWYLVEGDGGLTVVDTGVPDSWSSLAEAVATLGRSLDDVAAVVLTHAHYDHMGFAERARRELGVPVHVHEVELPLTRHPWRFDHEKSIPPYVATHPQALPIVASFLRHRALWPPPLRSAEPFGDAAGPLPVPGAPEVVFSPGHTYGHCALHLPDRGVLLTGDAIVMLDPYTARRGPRLVARAATADSARNLRSLDALAATGARTVLTGHGEPWTQGIESAVAEARSAGAA